MLLASLSLMPAVAAAEEAPFQRYARYALNNARLLGLTPQGTTLWAQHLMSTGDWRKWRRATEIETLIGQQLALDEPDRRMLQQLAKDFATESARAAQVRKQRTISTAMQLSARDRKAIGAYLEERSRRELRPAIHRADLAPAVAAAVSGFYSSFGVSPQGTKMLVEAAAKAVEAPRTREKIELAIGEQLRRDRPDRQTLNDLVKKYAAEEARLERLDKEGLIENGFMLAPADRKRFAAFLARSAAESLTNAKPVLEIVP